MPIIIDKLSYSYLAGTGIATSALHDISFTIKEGEFFAIIGHTGSGKSTLMQNLNGLLLPTSGHVIVDGLDTADKKVLKKVRSLVGMVFQYPEYQLFEETVLKDVAFGPKNNGYANEEATELAMKALELVGLDPNRFGEMSPFDLSGGEKRRAALAGILAMKPKYLALDEPMAGLDPRGRSETLALLNKLREETGCAIIMVSHSMDDVARCAERVAVLDHGSLHTVDTTEKVFSDSKMLKDLGLALPKATEIAERLMDAGIPLKKGIVTIDGLAEALKEVASGEH